MQPGSLIFLVIVAVWAVYLVQHWIRRREHVATARSVDRFSEAMRVLERRPAPRVSATSVAPATTPVTGSLVGRSAARPLVGTRTTSAPVTAAAAAGPVGSFGRPDLTGPHRGSRSGSGLLGRRVRGLTLLASLVAVPVTALLSLLGVLLWVSVVVALAAVVVTVAWLRVAVRRERAVRRAVRVAERRRVRPPRPESAARRPDSAPRRSDSAPHRPDADGSGSAVMATLPAASDGAAEHPTRVEVVATAASGVPELQESEVYDLHAVHAADRAAVAARLSAEEWSPVPVPTPTYMLKDSAPRPAPEPAEYSLVPVPIEVEDDDLERLMADRHRRITG